MLKSNLAAALTSALLLSLPCSLRAQNPTPLLTKDADQLVAVLKSSASQKEKADACRELAVIGNEDAVAPLVALLADEQLSHMARYGLETIPGDAVNQALRAETGKLKGRPLAGVIGSLGVRKDAAAAGLLSGFLQDPNNDVAQAAASALGKIGTAEAGQALQNALEGVSDANRLAVCEGALRCAESLAARKQRKPALALFDALRRVSNAPHQVRAAAVRAAILMRPKAGLKIIQESLRSPDYVVFAAATRAALEWNRPGITDALTAELPQFPSDRQIVVVQTLGQRGDAAALPVLSQAAKSGDKTVRLASIRALGQLHNAGALPGLLGLLGDSDRQLAQAAQETLASLEGPEVDATVRAMLNSDDGNQRLAGIDLVARRRMTACLPELLKAGGGADAKVRPAALRRVGELGGPSEAPALLELSGRLQSSDDLEALEQALSAICGKAQDPEAGTEQLTRHFGEAKPAQKGMLLRVLSAVGGPGALKAVRGAVNDSNPDVRAAAIRALGAWKTADAAPDLMQLAKNASNETDRTLCLRSYLGLAGNSDVPAEQRLSMCRQAVELANKPEEKKLLLAALGAINSAESIGLIMPHLEDAATKEEASAAVLSIAERLLRGRNAAAAAPKLVEPLEKVSQTTTNPDLATRAKTLLQQAQTRARSR